MLLYELERFLWLFLVGTLVPLLYHTFVAVRKRDVYGVLRFWATFMFAILAIELTGHRFGWPVGSQIEAILWVYALIIYIPIFCYGCMRLYTDIKKGVLSRIEIIERVVLLICWVGLLYVSVLRLTWADFMRIISISQLSLVFLFVHYSILLYRKSAIARKTH